MNFRIVPHSGMGREAWALLALLVTLLSAAGVFSDDYHCYAEDPNPYLFFGSKTAYQLVRGKNNIKPVPGEPLATYRQGGMKRKKLMKDWKIP